MKLALPKGKLQKDTAALLNKAGFGLDDYNERSRSYRLSSSRFTDLFIKVFRERDIPIQVAIGNYDIGICGLDWMGELMAKYPTSDVIKLQALDLADLLSENGVLVLEHSRHEKLPGGLKRIVAYRSEFYGETVVSFFKQEGILR